MLIRLRLELSHLREHEVKHSFQDPDDPNCDKDIETLPNFLLHCPNYLDEGSTFLNIINSSQSMAIIIQTI